MENIQTIWNFDANAYAVIAYLKGRHVELMLEWNLENAYWNLRSLWGEIDAKLDRNKKEYGEKQDLTEQQHAEHIINTLDETRDKFLTNSIDAGTFFRKLEDTYRTLCYYMKKNGLYFKEGNDATKAALRR